MVSFKIFAGGYNTFIATYLFTAAGNSSTLELASRSPTGVNPSWIFWHPTSNRSLLYATNEWYLGAVQAFAVKPDGTLSTALDTISSSGDGPAHALALKSGIIAAMNYNTGNGRIFNTTTTASGVHFNVESAQDIAFPKPEGAISHPHQAYEYRNEILVPDLGLDTIWRLVPNDVAGSSGLFKIGGSIPQPKGSGPRHVQFYNDRLFVLHELSSTLSLQKIPALSSTRASIIQTVSIVPPGVPADAQMAAAEILIPPPSNRFPHPYIYVSNRNKGPTLDPRGDSIAIYEHVGRGTSFEGLRLVKHVFTGLNQIRGMEFGPGGEYLVAGGSEGTSGIAVLQRVDGGRDLKVVARDTTIDTRITFVWA